MHNDNKDNESFAEIKIRKKIFKQPQKTHYNMNTYTYKHEMPELLPHGWKQVVARELGMHRNTIANALRRGEGEAYNRIMACARMRYGKVIRVSR